MGYISLTSSNDDLESWNQEIVEQQAPEIAVTDFKINAGQNKRIWVVDNFYQDPHAVREFALSRDYIEGGIGRGFIGSRTREQYLFTGLKPAFERIMGETITQWEQYDMNGRFQYCLSGDPLVYHADLQNWAAIIYLTPDAPPECGTSTFVHKQSGVRHTHDPNLDAAFNQHTYLDRTPYQEVDVVGNVFNRLVIFDGRLIHSAREYFGWDINSCRLWQMFFFD